MSALEDLQNKNEITPLELCVLVMRNYQGSNDVSEKAAAELARLRAIEAAARGLVDRNNFAFNEDQLSTDIDALAAALQKG
jgi:hypothetical protein